MNRAIFSAVLSAAALLATGAAAAVQSDLLGIRFQEELREAISAAPAAPESAQSGDAEAIAVEAREAPKNVRSARDQGRVTLFMSEEELEAAAESLAVAEIGADFAESAIAVSERLVGFNPESEFFAAERGPGDFEGGPVASAAVAETPVPAAFGLMLAAIGLGGLVLRRARKEQAASLHPA